LRSHLVLIDNVSSRKCNDGQSGRAPLVHVIHFIHTSMEMEAISASRIEESEWQLGGRDGDPSHWYFDDFPIKLL